jgi:hypothetical protein
MKRVFTIKFNFFLISQLRFQIVIPNSIFIILSFLYIQNHERKTSDHDPEKG